MASTPNALPMVSTMIQNRRFVFVPILTLALAGLALAQADPHPVAPALSSKPGAAYTLYLNFAGFNYPGTWAGGTPGNVPAYDGATAASGFNETSITRIRQAWAAVAQKYVGFNINVTTVDPAAAGLSDTQRKAFYNGQARLMHTVIGGGNGWYSSGAGGVSYVGTTKNSYGATSELHTNWVFPNALGSGFPKYVAEAASHEDGHGLGLSHQVDPSALNGYSTNNGASGNGSYAPTMGVGYDSQRSTWRSGTIGIRQNNGSYVAGTQNDVAVILAQTGMGPLIDDGVGHSLATATSLAVTASGTVNVNSGASKGWILPASSSNPSPIGIRADGTRFADPTKYTSDFFAFRSLGGLVTLTQNDGSSFLQAGVADPGATLQGTLEIFNSAGVSLGTATQATNTLSRTFSANLAAGTYYAKVGSIGGVASTYDANSNYYTMGAYFLTGSGLAQPVPEPATLAVLGLGAAATLRRRRRKA